MYFYIIMSSVYNNKTKTTTTTPKQQQQNQNQNNNSNNNNNNNKKTKKFKTKKGISVKMTFLRNYAPGRKNQKSAENVKSAILHLRT